jgi:sugar O-acyltransferase (sialic acid O-acetyltransferase NeuD family)
VSATSTLWILGAGGHGRVVADAALASGRWGEIAFFDDDAARATQLGRFVWKGDGPAFFSGGLRDAAGAAIERHIAVGHNSVRDDLARRCDALGLTLATVVHPRAVVSAQARLAAGCFIAAGAVVAPGADISAVGIVNHGATVDHDNRLGRAVHVGPGAHLGGNVSAGDRAWVGLGAAVRQGIRIGAGATVGAGAVVVAGVTDNVTVVGNPARPLQRGADGSGGAAAGGTTSRRNPHA